MKRGFDGETPSSSAKRNLHSSKSEIEAIVIETDTYTRLLPKILDMLKVLMRKQFQNEISKRNFDTFLKDQQAQIQYYIDNSPLIDNRDSNYLYNDGTYVGKRYEAVEKDFNLMYIMLMLINKKDLKIKIKHIRNCHLQILVCQKKDMQCEVLLKVLYAVFAKALAILKPNIGECIEVKSFLRKREKQIIEFGKEIGETLSSGKQLLSSTEQTNAVFQSNSEVSRMDTGESRIEIDENSNVQDNPVVVHIIPSDSENEDIPLREDISNDIGILYQINWDDPILCPKSVIYRGKLGVSDVIAKKIRAFECSEFFHTDSNWNRLPPSCCRIYLIKRTVSDVYMIFDADGLVDLAQFGNEMALNRDRLSDAEVVDVIKIITRDLIQGITELHGVGIIHNNINENNILVERARKRVKITLSSHTTKLLANVQKAHDLEDVKFVLQSFLRKIGKENIVGKEALYKALDAGKSLSQLLSTPMFWNEDKAMRFLCSLSEHIKSVNGKKEKQLINRFEEIANFHLQSKPWCWIVQDFPGTNWASVAPQYQPERLFNAYYSRFKSFGFIIFIRNMHCHAPSYIRKGVFTAGLLYRMITDAFNWVIDATYAMILQLFPSDPVFQEFLM